MGTPAGLRYQDCSLLNFGDFDFGPGGSSCYQWVETKRFQITAAPTNDRELLRSLVSTEQFRDGYIGAGVEPAGTVHGPYNLDRISPDSYIRVSADSVVDYGLIHTEFHEIVTIDRVERTVRLIVAADDRRPCSERSVPSGGGGGCACWTRRPGPCCAYGRPVVV